MKTRSFVPSVILVISIVSQIEVVFKFDFYSVLCFVLFCFMKISMQTKGHGQRKQTDDSWVIVKGEFPVDVMSAKPVSQFQVVNMFEFNIFVVFFLNIFIFLEIWSLL